MTPIQIFIQVFLFYSSSYNAIKSYKTEGRAERLEATEYLISAAEAGKAVCEIENISFQLGFHFFSLFDFFPMNIWV